VLVVALTNPNLYRSQERVDRKDDKQRSNLPWNQSRSFFTFGRATPEEFTFHDLASQNAEQKETTKSEKATKLFLGTDKASYSSSANVSKHFKEARDEFGDRKFFPLGSRRQRGMFQKGNRLDDNGEKAFAMLYSLWTIELYLFSFSTEDDCQNIGGLVLGFDVGDYKCTNSMSLFYERREQERIQDARPAKPTRVPL
jgi:hypothetical protein